MSAITVTAKGDLGHSPKFGEIRQGQQYVIEETDFAPELFEVPDGFDVTPYLPQPVTVETANPGITLDDPALADTTTIETSDLNDPFGNTLPSEEVL
jgi:hypothetical protein